MKSLSDIPTILIAVVTAVVLWKFKKIQEPYIIVLAAIIGLAIKTFL
jgi:chromate transporter